MIPANHQRNSENTDKLAPKVSFSSFFRGFGEVFDFDFEMKRRSHKLLRTPFRFGGMEIPFRGVRITEDCIRCGSVLKGAPSRPSIRRVRNTGPTTCDVCGDCYSVCPADAIEVVNEG